MVFGVALFIVWSMAIILYFMRARDKTNLWFSGVFFVQGLGVLEGMVEAMLIPEAGAELQRLWLIRRFLATVCLRFFPYFLLVAGVSYTETFNLWWKRRLKYLALIPVLIVFGLDLLFIERSFLRVDLPQSSLYWATQIWAVPYYLIANYLFFRAYRRETDRAGRCQKLLILIALALPALIIMVMSLTVAQTGDWWKYLLVQSFLLAGFFLYFIGKYGLDGLKLRFEKEFENGTISGATIINHTVKNELSKISVELTAAREGIVSMEESLEMIAAAAEHMHQIIDRVQLHTQDFLLCYERHDLRELLTAVSASFVKLLAAKNIILVQCYLGDVQIDGDRYHLAEVVNNIMLNAIEAIEAGGRDGGCIEVELQATKKQAVITVTDNGVGIPDDRLSKVMTPFYSTKAGARVRGTGLFYCYNVVQKHGGEIRIISAPDQGTIVEIRLPLFRG